MKIDLFNENKTAPVAELLKREAGISKGSGEPNKSKIGSITEEN